MFRLESIIKAALASTALALASALPASGPALAQDATWLANPGSGDFYDANNWSPNSVPTGTATFSTSATTALTLGTAGSIGGWTLSAGASAYTFDVTANQAFTGAGIVINGGSATITNNNGGTLNFNNASTAGSANITNNSDLYFYGTSTADNAAITNNYNLRFYNASTAGSATIINNSGIGFYDTSSAGNAAITINGTLSFNNASSAGSATITNSGSLGFGGTATAGSATIINNNNLVFFGTSTAGSATVTNNSLLSFFDSSTGGAARLINGAGGTIDLSVLSAVGTAVGSIEGAGTIALGSKDLQVGGNDLSTTFSGVLQDGGSFGGTGGALTKTGTGTLTLSGTNTYTGATTVDGGLLAVNGSIASSSGVTVNSGGALGGTGTVGNIAIMSGGALAPGNSIGTLTVNGNLTFNAGSFYTVEVSPSAADRTNVTGIATLTGATVQAVALSGSFRAQTYTILNATGGFGGTEFAGLTGSSFAPGARNPHLTYDANNVFLVLDPGTIQLPAGTSGNQTNVANSINRFVEGGGTPPAAFDALLNMTDAQLTNALDQVSGQPAAAGQQAAYNASNQFMTAMFDPFALGRGGSAGSAATGDAPKSAPPGRSSLGALSADAPRAYFLDPRWSFWGTVYGGNTATNGSGGASDTTSRVVGVVAGADVTLTRDTTLGFALGGGSSSFGVSNGLGGGDADMVQTGLFAKHEMGAAYVLGGFSYTYQDATTNRTVTVSGSDELEAKFDANTFGGRIEAGYRYVLAFAGITPYGAVQVTDISLPGYEESALSGSSAFALSYDGNDTTITRTELGARFDRAIRLDDGLITLRGRLAWAHDEGNDGAVSATFLSLPGSAFTVHGTVPSEDLALVTAGAEMKWLNNLSIGGTFEGEFSENTAGYAGKGTVRYAW